MTETEMLTKWPKMLTNRFKKVNELTKKLTKLSLTKWKVNELTRIRRLVILVGLEGGGGVVLRVANKTVCHAAKLSCTVNKVEAD